MITIIDYEAGNIKSVENAVRYLGREAVLTRDPEVILSSDHCILPGVGAFGDAMARLRKYGLDEVIKETVRRGIPFLGICLGLQLLFESSEEDPGTQGLGILKGKILRIPDTDGRKVPQIGWNDLSFPRPTPIISKRPTPKSSRRGPGTAYRSTRPWRAGIYSPASSIRRRAKLSE